jgi:hypothetical protein
MKRAMAAVLVLVLAGCTGEAEKKKEGLGKATADISNDTQVLGGVEAAANDVLRNPADCDAVKAALPEANRAIAEAQDKLRTTAARATLDALKTQVKSAAQNCP